MFLKPRNVIIDGIIPIVKESNNNYHHILSLIRKSLRDYKFSPFRWTYLKLVPLYPLDHFTKGLEIIGIGKGCNLLSNLVQYPQKMQIKGTLGRETTDGTIEGSTVSLQSAESITNLNLEQTLKSLIGERNFASIVQNTPTTYKNQGNITSITHIKNIKLIELEKSESRFAFNMIYTGQPNAQSLTSKIGELLGVGACLIDAHRTDWGPFSLTSNVLAESQISPQSIIDILQLNSYDVISKVNESSEHSADLNLELTMDIRAKEVLSS